MARRDDATPRAASEAQRARVSLGASAPRPARCALLAVGLASSLAACVTSRVAGPPDPARRPPPELVARYARPGPVPEGRVEVVSRRPRLLTLEVTVPARHDADAPPAARRPLSLRWWRPAPEGPRRPLVLMAPILGGDLLLLSDLAVDLASKGFHAAVLRRERPEEDAPRSVAEVEARLAADVSAQVQALDWLLERPDVDPDRVASFGISAGGIQCAIVAGVDPRYRAHVIALAGGPLADVLVDSDEPTIRTLVARGKELVGLDDEALRAALAASLSTDPIAVARYVPPERVLFVLATKDRSVPTATGRRLQEALGHPETLEIGLGHREAILALPLVKARIHAFLYEHLGRPPP